MNPSVKIILYFIGTGALTAIFGLLYIHYFIKIPSLLEGGQRPSFWASLISGWGQSKDSNNFLDLATKSQDSYLHNALKVERFFIYLFMITAVCMILLLLFMN